jgi:hypothetical protein
MHLDMNVAGGPAGIPRPICQERQVLCRYIFISCSEQQFLHLFPAGLQMWSSWNIPQPEAGHTSLSVSGRPSFSHGVLSIFRIEVLDAYADRPVPIACLGPGIGTIPHIELIILELILLHIKEVTDTIYGCPTSKSLWFNVLISWRLCCPDNILAFHARFRPIQGDIWRSWFWIRRIRNSVNALSLGSSAADAILPQIARIHCVLENCENPIKIGLPCRKISKNQKESSFSGLPLNEQLNLKRVR